MTTTIYYVAGSLWHPGTNLPSNVTGECPHRHRTPAAAQACIDRLNAAIRRGHGPNARCDRRVVEVVEDEDGAIISRTVLGWGLWRDEEWEARR